MADFDFRLESFGRGYIVKYGTENRQALAIVRAFDAEMAAEMVKRWNEVAELRKQNADLLTALKNILPFAGSFYTESCKVYERKAKNLIEVIEAARGTQEKTNA